MEKGLIGIYLHKNPPPELHILLQPYRPFKQRLSVSARNEATQCHTGK
jgi:hypothetical protein